MLGERIKLMDGTKYRHNVPPLAPFIAGEDMDARSPVAKSKVSDNMILLADADDQARMPCIGAIYDRVLLGQEAMVVPAGMVTKLQQDAVFQPGDPIYVSVNKGKFTRTEPVVGTKQVVGVARNQDSALLYCIPPQLTPVEYGHSEPGNHKMLAGTTEQLFGDDFGVWHAGMLWVEFDLSGISGGTTITARLKHKIDETNLRQIARAHALVGTDKDHLTVAGAVTAGQMIELSLQVDVDNEDVTVNHVYMQES